jgi:hypothetical protein
MGFQKRSCRRRVELTSSPTQNELELGIRIDTRIHRLLLDLELDTQYFSIADIGGVDTWFHWHLSPSFEIMPGVCHAPNLPIYFIERCALERTD